MNTVDAKRVLETALICAPQPVTLRELRSLFDDVLGSDTVKDLLQDLQKDWALKGVELVQVASGWRFQSRPEMRVYMDKLHPEKPPKYTRATLETLAIIAYRQPCVRSEIEAVRGVAVDAILRNLLEMQLVRVVGRSELPGRPWMFGTTQKFMEHFGLKSLADLPGTDELRRMEAAQARARAPQAAAEPPPEDPNQLKLPAIEAEAPETPSADEAIGTVSDEEEDTFARDDMSADEIIGGEDEETEA